jgi:hypothetical protein
MQLEQRLENWGDVLRWRKHRQGLTMKTKWRGSRFGSEQGAPSAPPAMDAADARVINHAWQAMGDVFHQTLLAAWYVNRWSDQHVLRVSWEAAGENARQKGRRSYDFEASLAMARALLVGELDRPAVTRRTRIALRICNALGIPQLPEGIDNVVTLAAA